MICPSSRSVNKIRRNSMVQYNNIIHNKVFVVTLSEETHLFLERKQLSVVKISFCSVHSRDCDLSHFHGLIGFA